MFTEEVLSSLKMPAATCIRTESSIQSTSTPGCAERRSGARAAPIEYLSKAACGCSSDDLLVFGFADSFVGREIMHTIRYQLIARQPVSSASHRRCSQLIHLCTASA